MSVVTARVATAIIVRTNRGCAMSSIFVVCTACGVSAGVPTATMPLASIICCRARPTPEHLCDYDNLVYACCQCNALKQDAPTLINPCAEGLGQHLEIQSDGSVRALTEHGAEQIALCRLNRPRLLEARRTMLELLRILADSVSGEARAFLRLFHGFPDNLPRLSVLKPPDGNARPESIVDSYYAKRQRGELPETY